MAEQPNYRPNVKLALTSIATKWNAQGNPLEYLLDASDALSGITVKVPVSEVIAKLTGEARL